MMEAMAVALLTMLNSQTCSLLTVVSSNMRILLPLMVAMMSLGVAYPLNAHVRATFVIPVQLPLQLMVRVSLI